MIFLNDFFINLINGIKMSFLERLKEPKFLGIFEQAISSGASFLFFLIAARVYGVSEFSKFGVIFFGVQLVYTILAQWCYLPIITFSNDVSAVKAIKISAMKFLKVAALLPFFSVIYLYIFNNVVEFTVAKSVTFIFYILSFCLFDFFKYLYVRYKYTSVLLFLQLSRWIGVYICILGGFDILGAYFYPVFISLIVFVIHFTFFFYPSLLPEKNNNVNVKISSSKPLLYNAVANNIQTVLINISFASINVSIIGAFLAFRSLTNFIPVILQYLEVHLASDIARNNKRIFPSRNAMLSGSGGVFIILALLSLFHHDIVSLVYGEGYLEFSYLLALMFFVVFIQSISRIVCINLRLRSKLLVFYYTGTVVIFSGLFAVITSYFFQNESYLFAIIAITPIIQLLLFVSCRK